MFEFLLTPITINLCDILLVQKVYESHLEAKGDNPVTDSGMNLTRDTDSVMDHHSTENEGVEPGDCTYSEMNNDYDKDIYGDKNSIAINFYPLPLRKSHPRRNPYNSQLYTWYTTVSNMQQLCFLSSLE
jgi:hypothetical protein